jgi:hypothetical protein
LGGKGRQISEFEASLVYRLSSRTSRARQRNSVSKKRKKRKKERKKERKSEQATGSKQAFLLGFYISSCLQIPSMITTMENYKLNKLFPPQLAFWSWCFVAKILIKTTGFITNTHHSHIHSIIHPLTHS